MKDYEQNHTINTRYLESVAGVRFAIREIAHLLHQKFSNDDATAAPKPQHLQQLEFDLIHLAENVCCDPVINTADYIASGVGPAVYLMKLLVRQYGLPCLRDLLVHHHWIVPKGLQPSNRVYIHNIMHACVVKAFEYHRMKSSTHL